MPISPTRPSMSAAYGDPPRVVRYMFSHLPRCWEIYRTRSSTTCAVPSRVCWGRSARVFMTAVGIAKTMLHHSEQILRQAPTLKAHAITGRRVDKILADAQQGNGYRCRCWWGERVYTLLTRAVSRGPHPGTCSITLKDLLSALLWENTHKRTSNICSKSRSMGSCSSCSFFSADSATPVRRELSRLMLMPSCDGALPGDA